MRLTHLADYAVVIMTAAARHEAGARLSATELADETGVPLPTAQKLMGQLANAGLLTSVRGAGGGFALARPVQAISLAEIVEAVEGPIAITVCSDGSTDCALDAHCRIKPHMNIVGNAVRGALGAVSLESLTHTPAHPEEGLSEVEGASRRTVLRDAISTNSMPVLSDAASGVEGAPQHERKGVRA